MLPPPQIKTAVSIRLVGIDRNSRSLSIRDMVIAPPPSSDCARSQNTCAWLPCRGSQTGAFLDPVLGCSNVE
jgi:hypothetical protein